MDGGDGLHVQEIIHIGEGGNHGSPDSDRKDEATSDGASTIKDV